MTNAVEHIVNAVVTQCLSEIGVGVLTAMVEVDGSALCIGKWPAVAVNILAHSSARIFSSMHRARTSPMKQSMIVGIYGLLSAHWIYVTSVSSFCYGLSV